MEIVSGDPADIVARRAYKAFRRIGKVDEYDPAHFVEGRIYIDGYTAYVTVEWNPYKERMRLDIAASSNDELSRVADQAMYSFAHTFKEIAPEDLDTPDPRFSPRALALMGVGVIVLAGLAAAMAFGFLPHGK